MPSSAHHYAPASATLTVTFVTGRRYAYARVPADEYAALRRSVSKGGRFNLHIRGPLPRHRTDPRRPRADDATLHARLAASIAREEGGEAP